jgi:hypothetical protein
MYINEIKNPIFEEPSNDPLLDNVLSGVEESAIVDHIPNWYSDTEFEVIGTSSPDNILYAATEYVSVSVLGDVGVKILSQKLPIPPVRYKLKFIVASRSTEDEANDIAVYMDNRKIYSTTIPANRDVSSPMLIEIDTPVLESNESVLSILFNGVEGELAPLVAGFHMDNQGISDGTNGYSYSFLDNYVSSRKVKMIGVSGDDTYVLQVTDPNLGESNAYKTYDHYRDEICGGIFESTDFLLEDHIANPNIGTAPETEKSVYGPLGKFMATIQCGDVAISIKPKTHHGVAYHVNEGYIEEQMTLMVYDADTLAGGDYPNFTDLSDELAPGNILANVPFNFMTKQPITLEYYNFDTGVLYGNSFKMKNAYNLDWDVESMVQRFGEHSVGELNNTRSYTNIGIGGSDAWVSFRIGDSYSGISSSFDPTVDRPEHRKGVDPSCGMGADFTVIPQHPTDPDIVWMGPVVLNCPRSIDENSPVTSDSNSTGMYNPNIDFRGDGTGIIPEGLTDDINPCHTALYDSGTPGSGIVGDSTNLDFYNLSLLNDADLRVLDTDGIINFRVVEDDTNCTVPLDSGGRLHSHSYEHIERIVPQTRGRLGSSHHKSNIYSIRISDSGLNESITEEDVRKVVQDSINASIRDVVKKAAPIETQLWQINWEGA